MVQGNPQQDHTIGLTILRRTVFANARRPGGQKDNARRVSKTVRKLESKGLKTSAMRDQLLDLATAATGSRELWNTLCGLRIDISIGGPIWAMKGWPAEKTFDQILTLNTVREHIVFTP